jgi:hypothetical protein
MKMQGAGRRVKRTKRKNTEPKLDPETRKVVKINPDATGNRAARRASAKIKRRTPDLPSDPTTTEP